MKIITGIKLSVITCLLILAFLPLGCAAETAIEPNAWDFGEVKEGEVLKHNFILKNESAKKLNIKEVNTSCGCTVSKVDRKIISPGESASIEVEFDSKGYSGPSQQFVYVTTDSLDKPVIRYIIKAEVIK